MMQMIRKSCIFCKFPAELTGRSLGWTRWIDILVTAGISLNTTETTLFQRITRLLPPLHFCSLCIGGCTGGSRRTCKDKLTTESLWNNITPEDESGAFRVLTQSKGMKDREFERETQLIIRQKFYRCQYDLVRVFKPSCWLKWLSR